MTGFADSNEIFHPFMTKTLVGAMMNMKSLVGAASLAEVLIPLQALVALNRPFGAEDVGFISFTKF